MTLSDSGDGGLAPTPDVGGAPPRPGHGWRAVRLVGALTGLVAVGLCVRALVRSWPTVSADVARADVAWLTVGLLLSAASMVGLALLWRRVIATFDAPRPPRRVVAWYFAGELGKYVPGAVWPIVGRGELARRGGVPRGRAYATTLLSLALSCVGTAIVTAVLAPVVAHDSHAPGRELVILLLVPLAFACCHPAVSGLAFGVLGRVSKGHIELVAPSFTRMAGLVGTAAVPWLFYGGAAVAVARSLGYDTSPARIAMAAVIAWAAGFLAVPVPAGAGVRELVFVAVCGLPAGQAVAVAAIARVLLILTDGVGGALAIGALARSGAAITEVAAATGPVEVTPEPLDATGPVLRDVRSQTHA